MKRKTKITISALAVMFVAAIAVAIASFSFAGGGKGDDLLSDSEIIADASSNVSDKTIIDYIIENSNSTDEEVDKEYHIAEITSGTASTLETFVKSEAFKRYVIDGNRTIMKRTITVDNVEQEIDNLMAEKSITFQSYTPDVTDVEALKYISNADLIYVTNEDGSKFSKTNDLSEDLYDILHTYSLGDFKPLIIDNPVATKSDDAVSKNMKDLASSVYGPNEKYYYAFKWATGLEASDYLSHTGGSLYLGINGKTQMSVWGSVYETDPVTDTTAPPMSMARILTVTQDGSTDRTDKLLTGNTAVSGGIYTQDGTELVTNATSVRYYKMADDSIMSKNGYNARTVTKPVYFQNDIVTLADSEALNFDQYDMIVIEDSCFGLDISNALYKKYAQAMYSKIHVVYSSEMGTADATEIPVPDDYKDTNYTKLFYLLATANGVSRYENVMITNRAEFSLITSSTSASTAKVIADLINASKYRGIGGRGSSSSMFTVLEIQPCYPIDEDVAQYVGTHVKARNSEYTSMFGSGNYYTVPMNVVNGKSKEQLEEGTEYYAWELTKAKLADALNLPVDKINLVQMSSEEFACDKTEILGNYDLVYIGGNTTALKSLEQYMSIFGINNSGGKVGDVINTKLDEIKKLPIYTMYTHSGELVSVSLDAMGDSGGPVRGGKNYSMGVPLAKVKVNGEYKDTIAPLNGNDITNSRYTALKSYIDAGMPVVVSKELTNAFNIAVTDGYLQNCIDPDSNMYKVLAACKASKSNNVLWSFDQTQVEDILSDGTLGDTVTGYVSVFKDKATVTDETGTHEVDGPKKLLGDIYVDSAKRPKLALTSMPAIYNRFDENTKLDNRTLKFKYDVTNSSDYTVKLYIDDDGNSKFDRKNEYMAQGDKTTLTYTCADNFFGPVYWMIEVTDKNTNVTASQTGISYIKNRKQEQQPVNVLQIMPGETATNSWDKKSAGEGAEGWNALYFCTVCQQAYQRLEYNPYSNAGSRNGYSALYGGQYYDTANGIVENKYYLGKHEHKFGIVSYDSTLEVPGHAGYYGMDYWDNNLADEIGDLYDFDIDIVLRSEFEQMAQDASKAYDYVVDDNGNVTKTKVPEADKKKVVDTFVIGTDDAEADKYQALETVDEKYQFIMKRKYEELASTYWQLYQYMKEDTAKNTSSSDDSMYKDIKQTTKDARADLDEQIDKMISNLSSDKLSGVGVNCSVDEMKSELKRLKKLETYSDYYSIANKQAIYVDISKPFLSSDGSVSMNTYLSDYFKAKDKELDYKELYKKYSRYAAGNDWLQDCYDSVILGPSEDFAADDITDVQALADLKSYILADKQLILFHDTLTKFANGGSSTLTSTLRPYFGMDRYHMGAPETDKADEYYVHYTSDDKDKYFMTNMSWKTEDSKYASWYNDMKSISPAMPQKYLTSVAYTDVVNVGRGGSGTNRYTLPYKYADVAWKTMSFWGAAASFNKTDNEEYGTDRASQNNVGIVTTYPFTLASELYISGTHPQAYALDIEDDDLTVWYSLAGGSNSKDGSSIFAASPKDGMDNYFIYTYKNVNYCGAGHTKVTGVFKNNNDERYLYINLICNSVRNSVKQPTINIYDYGTENNNIFKRDASDAYYTKVDSDTAYPDFSFKVTVDKSEDVTLSNVKIFYDLDYSEDNTSNAYTADANHILIANWSSSTNVEAGKIRDVFRYDSDLLFREKLGSDGKPIVKGIKKDANGNDMKDANGNPIYEYEYETENHINIDGTVTDKIENVSRLKLQPSYFAPYNNEYTYLVIEATDSAGNKVYQRVKIMIKPRLFDLT